MKYGLFQKKPTPDWTRRKKLAFWVWNFVMYGVLCGLLGLVSLVLSVGSYQVEISLSTMKTPILLCYNVLPVIALGLILYALIGRGCWAYGATGLIVLGLSVGNYYKIALRDDPLMLGDLLLLREAGNMLGRYDLFLSKTILCTLVCFFLGFFLLRFLQRGRPGLWLRTGSAVCGIGMLVCLVPQMLDGAVYSNTFYPEHITEQYSATQQYIAHGFVYPFLYSYRSTVDTPPEGYDEGETEALLGEYEDQDIPEEQRVNIIGIMLEAFNDLSRYDSVELNRDVYEVWHQLKQEGYSGELVTNIFAAGTVDTERAFLTGQTELVSYRGNTNSYPWYFRSQGYYVDGMHPSESWFYNRRNVNEHLGFQNYSFLEDREDDDQSDDTFFAELIEHYQECTAQGVPYFNFSVTFQGHGPYTAGESLWAPSGSYLTYDDRYNIYQFNTVENYFGSVENTNENLKMLTDYLREDTQPVILILFGDHNPFLGENNLAYEYLGIDLNNDTQEGFLNYYSTEYIIWGNDAAKQVLGKALQGTGPAISPSFLMHQLFRLCGWEGPAFMQATQEVLDAVPVIHSTGRYLYQGQLTAQLPAEQTQLVENYKKCQYYWRTHFAYGKE